MISHRFLLCPSNWKGSERYLCRPLLGSSQNDSEMPWLALGYLDRDRGFVFVERDGLDETQIRELLNQAQQNLTNSSSQWRVSETSGFLFFKKPSLLQATTSSDPALLTQLADIKEVIPGVTMSMAGTIVPDDYCCEQLLNVDFMQQASTLLGKQELIAIIPKRGWLMVAPGRAGEIPQMVKMGQAATGVYSRAGELAITALAFFVQNGRLIGINSHEQSYLSMLQPIEEFWFKN
jgi:hypothetical protein